MSSHREAPAIAQDAAADSTDLYAFVSGPGRVTLIANYIPFQLPASGPNFYEFGDDVLYQIQIDNDGDGVANVAYQFRFSTHVANPATFLYNVGPIDSLTASTWNRRQTYSVTKVSGPNRSVRTEIATDVPCPPCNIGPRSTPDYGALAAAAVQTLPTGEKVFAGQRSDPFFVDIGSIFDLGTLRPVQDLHLISTAAAAGVDTLARFNVNTIAIEVDIADLTRDGQAPTDVLSPMAVIGVWTTAHRQKATMRDMPGLATSVGPFVQVSRLGNPLVNEVIVPMARKDEWNAVGPSRDVEYEDLVKRPELAGLLPVLYPDAFPNLAAYDQDRADLHAILLTGIPEGVVDGFQNFTGPQPGDMLRLNVAIAPSEEPNPLGLVGGDPAGFPNGRRLVDDVTTIELRAVAGLTIPLVDPDYTPDGAAGAIADGSFDPSSRGFLGEFPFVAAPLSGYDVPAAS
jgi:hypothetical protein